MADKGTANRECPFCREEVRQDALRCRHCQSAIEPERPEHGGTCPFCKEQINPAAIRCKHCHADLGPTSTRGGHSGCAGCGGGRARDVLRYASVPTSTAPRRRAVPRSRNARLISDLRSDARSDAPSADPGCADTDTDDAGTWCFLESSEHFCIYELCEPAPTSPYTVFR